MGSREVAPGYTGKNLVVNLTSGRISEKRLPDDLYRDFIGGVGLGARLLYECQPGKVDPLRHENILGFMPGLLKSVKRYSDAHIRR